MLNPSPMNGRIFEMPLGCVDYLILNEVEAAQILEADTRAISEWRRWEMRRRLWEARRRARQWLSCLKRNSPGAGLS